MSSRVKTIALLRKLKTLAELGVDGEKETAQRMLERISKKHGIPVADIEGLRMRKRFFYYVQEDQQLLFQILSSVLGKEFYNRAVRGEKQYRYRWMVTDAEAIEIWAKLDFYIRLFKAEQKTLLEAFVIKHNLFPQDGVCIEWGDLTRDQQKQMHKVNFMISGLRDETYLKKVSNG